MNFDHGHAWGKKQKQVFGVRWICLKCGFCLSAPIPIDDPEICFTRARSWVEDTRARSWVEDRIDLLEYELNCAEHMIRKVLDS